MDTGVDESAVDRALDEVLHGIAKDILSLSDKSPEAIVALLRHQIGPALRGYLRILEKLKLPNR